MTYDGYLNLVDRTNKEHPEWRYGQTLFNILHRVRPDLSEKIRGSKLDPFYKYTYNEIHPFLRYVQENW